MPFGFVKLRLLFGERGNGPLSIRIFPLRVTLGHQDMGDANAVERQGL